MNLAEYVAEYGEEQAAADLSERLGKKITPNTVRLWKSRAAPEAWREALGLDDSTPEAHVEPPSFESGTASGSDSPQGRQAETPPRPLPGAKLAPTSLEIASAARERIAALHVFAGTSVAALVDSEGMENDRGVGGGITKLWTDKADPIAEAWLAWAREGNKFAQAFVRLMATGGAGGDLLLGYVTLLGGTAYIMGQLPDNEATRVVYGRYSRYRTIRVEPEPADRDEEPVEPGAGPDGAGDFMGTAFRPPGL